MNKAGFLLWGFWTEEKRKGKQQGRTRCPGCADSALCMWLGCCSLDAERSPWCCYPSLRASLKTDPCLSFRWRGPVALRVSVNIRCSHCSPGLRLVWGLGHIGDSRGGGLSYGYPTRTTCFCHIRSSFAFSNTGSWVEDQQAPESGFFGRPE